MDEHRPHASRLFPVVLAVATLLLLVQALWFYLMGDYGRILLPALLSPVMLVATLLAAGAHSPSRASAYLVLICGFLLTAVELPRQAGLPALWVGLPPVLALLLLPLGPAMLLNLALTPIWLALLGNGEPERDLLLVYLALVAVAALVPWERLRQQALLRATDPWERECRAVTRDNLHERLAGEFERAEFLECPLAVLLIHLPQVDMAGEQFGAKARTALLEGLCRGVISRCREHDVLGREGDAAFWLLLPDTTESGALLVRHRLTQALSQVVLVETGPLQLRTRLAFPRPDETWPHFEQRLQALSHSLADG